MAEPTVRFAMMTPPPFSLTKMEDEEEYWDWEWENEPSEEFRL